jgi:hypothetical protein
MLFPDLYTVSYAAGAITFSEDTLGIRVISCISLFGSTPKVVSFCIFEVGLEVLEITALSMDCPANSLNGSLSSRLPPFTLGTNVLELTIVVNNGLPFLSRISVWAAGAGAVGKGMCCAKSVVAVGGRGIDSGAGFVFRLLGLGASGDEEEEILSILS